MHITLFCFVFIGMKFPTIKNQAASAVIRGILHAVILSLVLVLVFALVIWAAGLSSGAIKPVVQVIKVASIFWGVVVAIRHIERHGWLFGALVGLLYMVLIFFVFSIVDADFGITSGLIADILFACVIGAFSAMILKTLRAQVV